MLNDKYKIDNNTILNIEKVLWNDVRDEVYKINPELTEICDNVNKYSKYGLYKIHYPYGALIITNSKLHLPTVDGKLIPINDQRIPEYLKKDLTYTSIPLSCVLKNSVEVFMQGQNKFSSLNFLNVGEMFGLFETTDYLNNTITDLPIWSVSSGARSVFMVPSITNTLSHNNIKKELNISANIPCNLTEHWRIFYEINKYFQSWSNTILVFSSEWFQNISNLIHTEFYQYLFKKCWQQLHLSKNFFKYDKLWLQLTDIINKRNLKPRSYIIDTVKYLILISQGHAIAFEPAVNNEALPNDLIQKIYINNYQLKHYIPQIMQPAKFTNNNKVYYSLNLPNICNSSTYCINPPSIMEDQRYIYNILNIILKVDDPVVKELLANKKFELFHANQDILNQIVPSKIIPESDARFLAFNDKNATRTFCSSSIFFNGCIRVS